MTVELSVLIVSHGHAPHVRACLDSLREGLAGLSYEIIVIDNLAEPDFIDRIGGQREHVRIVANDTPLGFGANNNKAASLSSGRMLLILNPDTSWRSGSVAEAMAFLDADPQRGVLAARLVNPDGTPQNNVRRFPSLLITGLRGFGASRWKHPPKFYADAMMLEAETDKPRMVDWAYGSFLMIRRDVYEEVGGFDEAFFMYYEDVDLCWRLGRRKYQVWAWPDLEFTHDHQRSSASSLFSATRRHHIASLLRYAARSRAILRAPDLHDVDPAQIHKPPMIAIPGEDATDPEPPWAGLRYVLALFLVLACLLVRPLADFLVAPGAESLSPTSGIALLYAAALLFFQFILNEMHTDGLGDASRRAVGILESSIMASVATSAATLLWQGASGVAVGLYLLTFSVLATMACYLVTVVFAHWVRTPGVRTALVIIAPPGALPDSLPALPVGLQTIVRVIRVEQQSFDAVAEDVGEAVRNRQVDALYICGPDERGSEVLMLLHALKSYDLPVWYHHSNLEHSFVLVRLRSSLRSRTREALKSGLDVALCLVALPTLLISCAVVGLMIWIEDPGPIFFRQKREGRNRVQFDMFKFRSMYVDQSDLNADALTTTNDARITKVGAFIRRTSIDELPQLFNVLRGEMSLIGPRPLPVGFHFKGARFDVLVPDWDLRTRVKPGITGLSQIKGLRGTPNTYEEALDMMRDRAVYDNLYIDRWTIWSDLKILATTVFGGRFMAGAY